MKINRVKSLNGEITIPGDKSISHRSIMFGSIAHSMSATAEQPLGLYRVSLPLSHLQADS